MNQKDIIATIRQELDRRGITPFRAAIRSGLPENAIRYVLEGRDSKISRLVEICAALDLELYIGPPRDPVSAERPEPDKEERSLVDEIRSGIREDLAEALRQVVGENQTDPPATTRQVEVRELAAIAGGGAMVMDETVIGYVLFQRNWLDRHGLDPTQCTVINVMGESMEPTLPNGSKILVDRSHRRPRHGRIFVVRTSDGLVVKRVEENEAGSWTLKSDQQEHQSAPWGNSEIIGEVRWIGITL